MGGGPSLVKSERKIREPATWVSANDHGARLRPVDYCATVDTWHLSKQWKDGEIVDRKGGDIPVEQRVHMRDWLDYGVPIISYRGWADHVTGLEAAVFDSGMYSAYVAWLMGGAPVVIIGIDCYRGDVYWHQRGAHSGSLNKPEVYFQSRAALLAEVIGTERVRMIGDGPLAGHFPQYDPYEAFNPDYRDVLDRDKARLERTRVRCQRDGLLIEGKHRRHGNVVDADMTDEVRQMLDNGEVVECR